jgi:hypothetical protein
VVETLQLRLEDEDYKLTVFINDVYWEIVREPRPAIRRKDMIVATKVSDITAPYNVAVESMFMEIDEAVAKFKQKLQTLLQGKTEGACKE